MAVFGVYLSSLKMTLTFDRPSTFSPLVSVTQRQYRSVDFSKEAAGSGAAPVTGAWTPTVIVSALVPVVSLPVSVSAAAPPVPPVVPPAVPPVGSPGVPPVVASGATSVLGASSVATEPPAPASTMICGGPSLAVSCVPGFCPQAAAISARQTATAAAVVRRVM